MCNHQNVTQKYISAVVAPDFQREHQSTVKVWEGTRSAGVTAKSHPSAFYLCPGGNISNKSSN